MRTITAIIRNSHARFALFVLLAVVLVSFALSASAEEVKPFFQDRERGWFWYEEPAKVQEVVEEKTVTEKAPESADPLASLKNQGKEWEQAMATAILAPTEENIARYAQLTQQIRLQADRFADAFKETLWVNPQLDYTMERPVNPQAIIAFNETRNAKADTTLSGLSDRAGLVYFFRSDCPYCKRFSPILRRFSEHYGFSVIPVSLDGIGSPEYPYPKQVSMVSPKIRELATNVQVVPGLFLVEPDSNTVVTVGFGYSDWTELTQKVLLAGKRLDLAQNGQTALASTQGVAR